MKTLHKTKKKHNRLSTLLAAAGLFSLALICCALLTSSAAEPIEYIYFDLAAGNVSVNATTYTGYVYHTDTNGTTTKLTVTGSHKTSNHYYVYQTTDGNRAVTGYTGDISALTNNTMATNHSQITLPLYDRVTYTDTDGKTVSWGEYITNHPKDRTSGDSTAANSGSNSVKQVINAWVTAVGTTRTETEHTITFSGNVSNADMVLDNIWCSYQGKGKDRSDGGITYFADGSNIKNNSVILRLNGDNRFANIFYHTYGSTNGYTLYDYKNRMIFDILNDDTSTLTVANNASNMSGNWWASAIGSSDINDACCGLVFKNGVIYAGTTAEDDCTAIGGGGNGVATIWISGGTLTAVASGSGTAIGGGIGKGMQGGSANITIEGGEIYAYNFSYKKGAYANIAATAIGGGSSASASGCEYANVTITGGKIFAQSVGGTAIGAGNSTNANGGNATVKISGGEINAISIAGNLGVHVPAGVAIGGGTGYKKGGTATLSVSGNAKLYTGSIGGGGYTAASGSIGMANVTVSDECWIQGQIVMAGEGSTFDMSGGVIDNEKVDDLGYTFKEENGGAVCIKTGIATVTGGIIQNCHSPKGGAIYLTGGSFNLSDQGIIQNCQAENGGAVYLNDSDDQANISGGHIRNCNATQNGGAVYMVAGTFTLSADGNIQHCSAVQDGGAVYMGGGTANVSGGIIQNTNGINGGAVYMALGHFTLSGSGKIQTGTATTYGGGVYLGGGNATVKGGEISACQSKDGGAVYVTGGSVTLLGGQLLKNVVSQDGGGVYVKGGDYTMSGGTVQENTAQQHGGAIYVTGGNVIVTGGAVQQNTATQNGGGVYLTGGQFTLNGENAKIDQNKASSGGGVYLTKINPALLDGSISNNIADVNGGGICIDQQVVTLTPTGTVTLLGNQAQNGAGLYIGGTVETPAGFSLTAESTGSLILAQNIATQNGGGVCLSYGDFTVNGEQITLYGNQAQNGGGLSVLNGNFVLSGGSIGDAEQSENVATNGGGVYVAGGDVTVSGGQIIHNSAISGGGVYLTGGAFTLNGESASILQNKAQDGGGVYLTGINPDLHSGSITQNIATQNGGGIYIYKKKVDLTPTGNVSITQNTAQDGGGIYIMGTDGTDAGFTIHESVGKVTLQQNTATQNGGGVCLNNGSFTVAYNNITVIRNNAQNGGGVAVLSGNFDLSASSIGANEMPNTAERGGGVYVSGGNVQVWGSGSICYNQATQNGGGCYVANGNFAMIGGAVEHNSAQLNGGGIYVSANGQDVTADILSGHLQYNSAKVNGGAIAVVGTGAETITVQIGINEPSHFENGNRKNVHHCKGSFSEYVLTDENVFECPHVEYNNSGDDGGAVFISGSLQTHLNIYCIVEIGNDAEGEEDSRSNFMMVSGGYVKIETAETEIPQSQADSTNVINNSIHVDAGRLELHGHVSNPYILAPITVDVKNPETDWFRDLREGDNYYSIHYFENFTAPGATEATGQYTVYHVLANSNYEILGNVYYHEGYEMQGWNTKADRSGVWYNVGVTYLIDKSKVNERNELILYAQWESHSYTIVFSPGVADSTLVDGTMPSPVVSYNADYKLPKVAFVYKGYIFQHWTYNGKTYQDMQTVKNLTHLDGVTVTLVAVWEKCLHDDNTFTYAASGSVLTRTCTCLGYEDSATLYGPSNAVYEPGTKHSCTTYTPGDLAWDPAILTITYTKNGTPQDPINAGTYRASISAGDAEAFLIFIIEKATQPAPGVPTYTVNDEGNQLTAKEMAPSTKTGARVLYQLAYQSGGEWTFPGYSDQRVHVLDMAYTNYNLYVVYAETDNYKQSDPIMAQKIYYFSGDVNLIIDCDEGMIPTATENKVESTLIITVEVIEGYYIYGTVLTNNNGGTANFVSQRKSETEYHLTNIAASSTVQVYISGAYHVVEVTPTVTEGETFSETSKTEVTIGRDSAFTAHFAVNYYAATYQNPTFSFSQPLPRGTTLILLDRTNATLWYYCVSESKNSVPLGAFTQMGGNGSLAHPASEVLENNRLPYVGLSYQLIVDFSDCTTYISDPLTVSLIATPQSNVPAFTTNTVTVNLVDVTFDMKVTESNGAQNMLDISYATTENRAPASKWEDRCGALVLIPTTSLPMDATLYVQEFGATTVRSATYAPNEEGKFIVALSLGSGTVSITLQSRLFPQEQTKYTFTAKMYSSYTDIGMSPQNGTNELTEDLTLTFTAQADAEPSVKIEGTKNVIEIGTPVFSVDITLDVQETLAYSVILMTMSESGQYVNSGWIPAENDIVPLNPSNNNWEKYRYNIPIGSQIAGNYCVMVLVKNEHNFTVLSVPYYFVIH